MIYRSILQSILLTSLIAVAWQSATVCADVVTFTHAGSSASGTLDGNPFSNADFTITAVGDTDNVTSSLANQIDIQHSSASIEIVGVGTFNIIPATRTFFVDNTDTVGFEKLPVNGARLYQLDSDPALDGWDMLSSIGPINAQHTLLSWDFAVVDTSGGRLIFNDATINGTFQAVVVPEPTSSTLLGFGAIVGILVRSSRRRRQVQ